MSNLIKVGGKVFAKTVAFGNWKKKTVFKNCKRYDRNKSKQELALLDCWE